MIDDRIRSYLIGSGLSVGERIYPQAVPHSPTYPLVVYNTNAAPPADHRDGGNLMAMGRQFRVYASGQNEAWRVAWELRRLLLRFPMQIENMLDGYEPESARWYVVILATVWTEGD